MTDEEWWQHVMETVGTPGILVTLAEGESRLLPLWFSFRDGAWWAVAPHGFADHLIRCDGLPAEILFLDGDRMHVRGTLACGAMRSGRGFPVCVTPDTGEQEPPSALPRAA